jgi:hypothetical protein
VKLQGIYSVPGPESLVFIGLRARQSYRPRREVEGVAVPLENLHPPHGKLRKGTHGVVRVPSRHHRRVAVPAGDICSTRADPHKGRHGRVSSPFRGEFDLHPAEFLPPALIHPRSQGVGHKLRSETYAQDPQFLPEGLIDEPKGSPHLGKLLTLVHAHGPSHDHESLGSLK